MAAKLVFITQHVDPGHPALGATVPKIRALASLVDELVVLADSAVEGVLPPNCRARTFRASRRAARGLRFEAALASELGGLRGGAVVAHMCPIYAVLAAPLVRPLGVPLLLWFTHWKASRLLRLAGQAFGQLVQVAARVFRAPLLRAEQDARLVRDFGRLCERFWAHAQEAADELLAQVRWVLDRHPGEAERCAKLKVHFARMGEPALNDAVLEALERLPSLARSPGLWACVATTAPRGCEPWFEALRDVKDRRYRGRFQLQFSVQSTAERDRARLTPIPHWSLGELARYGARFWRPGDRKVVLNFALARDVAFDPEMLAATFDPARFAVKITPVNPTARGAESGFATVLRSERATAVERARAALGARGFDVILSVGEAEEDRIGSNCGQAVRVARPEFVGRDGTPAEAGAGATHRTFAGSGSSMEA